MKPLGNSMLWLAVAVTTLTWTAAAQTAVPRTEAPPPSLSHPVYLPGQSTARFTQVDWESHRRCDGDHDRDDRHCHLRVYADTPPARHVVARGWYDSRGFWHPAGWFDRYGR